MTYTAEQLVTNAYYLTGIVAEGFATPSSTQAARGLDRLNALLAVKSFDDKHIPYFTYYTFNTVINQEAYPITNLIRVETLTYNINELRLPSRGLDRDRYWEQPRVDNVSAYPFTWDFERNESGGTIYFYPLPFSVVPIKIWAKFALNNVTFSTDLSATYDNFYIEYLLYGTAVYLYQFNGLAIDPDVAHQWAIYQKEVINIQPLDVRLQFVNPFDANPTLNWAFVNLCNGFIPPMS